MPSCLDPCLPDVGQRWERKQRLVSEGTALHTERLFISLVGSSGEGDLEILRAEASRRVIGRDTTGEADLVDGMTVSISHLQVIHELNDQRTYSKHSSCSHHKKETTSLRPPAPLFSPLPTPIICPTILLDTLATPPELPQQPTSLPSLAT